MLSKEPSKPHPISRVPVEYGKLSPAEKEQIVALLLGALLANGKHKAKPKGQAFVEEFLGSQYRSDLLSFFKDGENYFIFDGMLPWAINALGAAIRDPRTGYDEEKPIKIIDQPRMHGTNWRHWYEKGFPFSLMNAAEDHVPGW